MVETRKEKINRRVQQLNSNLTFCAENELEFLPSILLDDEEILAISEAVPLDRKDLLGVIFATNLHLIFIEELAQDIIVKKYYNENITSIKAFPGQKKSTVSFTISDKNVDFEIYHAEDFYNKTKELYNKSEFKKEAPIKYESPEEIFTQLEKLGKLLNDGILTNQEFTEQKKKLLEKL